MTVSISSKPMWCCSSAFAMNSRRPVKRKVPAFVTRFTRKCPGYSSKGSRAGSGRGSSVDWLAGGCPSSAVCERSSL